MDPFHLWKDVYRDLSRYRNLPYSLVWRISPPNNLSIGESSGFLKYFSIFTYIFLQSLCYYCSLTSPSSRLLLPCFPCSPTTSEDNIYISFKRCEPWIVTQTNHYSHCKSYSTGRNGTRNISDFEEIFFESIAVISCPDFGANIFFRIVLPEQCSSLKVQGGW